MADDATGAGAGLDARAKAAYRTRVKDLQEEIQQARDWADPSARNARERNWTSSLASSPVRSARRA